MTLAAADAPAPADAGTGWSDAPTLHVGEQVFDRAARGSRQVHPVWIAGTRSAPVSLAVELGAVNASDTVRVAVLGPSINGERAVLAAAGYMAPVHDLKLAVDVDVTGDLLVVVGSYALQTGVGYMLDVECAACRTAATDLIAYPKAGALVAQGTERVLEARLGDVLAARAKDVELEVWASKPMQTESAVLVASAIASGTQVNVKLPDSVQAGDDLTLVVREPGGKILDTGFVTRFAPTDGAFARTDAILYGDIASLQIAGVAGFYEGRADLWLHSMTNKRDIAFAAITTAGPGALGNGFGAFDASFTPDLETDTGALNPVLPRNGEILAVGTSDGEGAFDPIACFEYCNDASGEATCTGGPRACE